MKISELRSNFREEGFIAALRRRLSAAFTARARASRALLLAGMAIAGGAGAADGPAPPPIKAFFRHPDIAAAVLSPSGRWVALVAAPDSGRRVLAVVDLTGEKPPTIAARFDNADVESPQWVSDERVVFSVIDLQSGGADQRFWSGLFVVRRDGSEFTELIATRNDMLVQASAVTKSRERLDPRYALLAIPAGGGDSIIVGEHMHNLQGDLIGVNASRLDVVTRKMVSLSYGRPEHAIRWLFDPRGEPRLIVAQHEGQTTIHWLGEGKKNWAVLARFPALKQAFHPQFVDGAGQLFVTTADGPRGTNVLKRFDFAAGHPEAQAIVSTPGFDFSGSMVMAESGSKAFGVRILTDAWSTVWFEPRMKELQAIADARFPGRTNWLSCRQCAAPDVVLVWSGSDQDPGSIWAYRPAEGKWQAIGRVRKDIEPREMAQLDLHRIQARDGEDLPVWFTTPRAPKGAPPPPAVVLVHGGPWVRGGSWQWHADAQFLASRGYAVIEPEFRGSTGYGRTHFEAGWKQWGGAMQDDVADAVKWASSKGMIDPKRVCIAGASYGGYATLMGLIRYPDLYRCGVAWAAVTDPRLLYLEDWTSDFSEETRRFGLPTILGDLKKDAAALADAAPVEHAAQIRVPVLLAFGSLDRRVPLQHGTQMRSALRAAGREPEWVAYADEGHGWLKTENQVDFWGRVERFLQKNLP